MRYKDTKSSKHVNERKLTESTDEIIDTTHITKAIFQLKTGVPHCSG